MAREGRSANNIANTLHVGKTFVHKIIRMFQTSRSIEHPRRPGKIRSLNGRFMLFLMQ